MTVSHLVSIITPSYNSSGFIAQTIESVIKQSYPYWEMIIVDDCSTDNSIDIIEGFQSKDSRIKLIKLKKNSGPAVARNTGIECASGRFLTFIDSDDIWMPAFLIESVNSITSKKLEFVFSSYEVRDESLNKHIKNFIVPKKVTYKDLLKTCPISCLTAFIDTQRVGKLKMPLLRKRQDYGLWLNYLKVIPEAYGIEKVLAIYRVRKNSVSRNKLIAASYQWTMYRKIEKLGFLKSLYYFLFYSFYGFLKNYLIILAKKN